jgi:uncharacterized glyoxalase superfamily protein PhnB
VTPNPPENTPRITPYLLYEDATAAIEWLTSVFGLRERDRMANEDGAVTHAELEFGDDGLVMIGHPGPDYRSPAHTGSAHGSLYVYVDDVDAHFERSRDAGAEILQEPVDEPYGDRRYGACDMEGHHWYFAARLG